MRLIFAHGWGYDRHFWAPLAERLSEWPLEIDDRGYFGSPVDLIPEGPCVAVTHSFGTIRILSAPPPGLRGIVAINGFERFTAVAGKPGVPLRVLDRMCRRFATHPQVVLADFHQSCGSFDMYSPQITGVLNTERLSEDLLCLRNAVAPLPSVPVISIQGGKDPLLPAPMRDTTFAGIPVHRIEHKSGGHLLPIEAPELCASAIHGLMDTVRG